jgi:hypothetical protein
MVEELEVLELESTQPHSLTSREISLASSIMILKDAGSPVTIRNIESLEKHMKEMPPVEMPVKNYFSQGAYARELFIKKGTVLTGKIHKHENLNIMPYGDITVLTHDGMKRLTGYNVVVSPAGTKRVAYAHEDTVWITVIGTRDNDVDEIVRTFTAESLDEYLDFCRTLEE